MASRDTPVSGGSAGGELDTHTGHGTFIAGIVRQVVPDAEVLAIRVMHGDGIVYEGDLLCALGRSRSGFRMPGRWRGNPGRYDADG